MRGVSHGFKALEKQSWRLQQVEQLINTSAGDGINLSANAVKNLDAIELFVVLWALVNAKAIQELDDRTNCAVVRYESLCEDPIQVARETFGSLTNNVRGC